MLANPVYYRVLKKDSPYYQHIRRAVLFSIDGINLVPCPYEENEVSIWFSCPLYGHEKPEAEMIAAGPEFGEKVESGEVSFIMNDEQSQSIKKKYLPTESIDDRYDCTLY